MAQTVDVTPPLRQDGASKHLIYFVILISASHLIANLIDNAQIAGCALIVLLCCVFFSRAMATTYFRSLFEVVFGTVLFGYLVQILGEIVGAWATSRLMLSLAAATTMLTVIAKSKIRKYDRASLFAFAAVPALFSTGWVFLLSLRAETLINFLGFGYDNAAHLAQTQLIINNHGTALIDGGIQSAPTFLQDVAQAGTSSLATFAELTSTSSKSTTELLFAFTLVTIAIPVSLILAIFLTCLENKNSRTSTALITTSTLLIFGTGYLSRIWFSGYFGSNLGTLLLALIAIAIVLRTFENPMVYVCAAIITAHVYPIFLFIGLLLLIVPLTSWISKLREERTYALSLLRMPIAFLSVCLSIALLLPVRATNRSYGGSQFLVDGGIEYVPFKFLLIWGGVFLVVVAIVTFRLEHRYEQLGIVLVSLTGSVLVSVYSQSEVGRITYYPTKFVITLAIISIAAILVSESLLYSIRRRTIMPVIALIAASTYMLFQPGQNVFTRAFMGEAQTTISSSLSFMPEIVQPSIVVSLSELSIKHKKPVLLISSNYESELNSRWINTISNQWNDFSWSNWMTIRSLILDKSWSAVADATTNANIIIGTDDKLVFNSLSVSIPNQICLLKTYGDCDFR